MSLAQYPLAVRGLTWPVMKTMEFATTVESATNFFQTRIANSQNPRWHWTLIYEYLKDKPNDVVASLSPYTDYRYLQGFLLSNQGQFAEFLLDDLTDDFLGAQPVGGGGSGSPSGFKVSTYPTQEFYYPTGSYIVDNNSTPHLQQVIQGGASGSSVPSFNTSGGNTSSGTLITHDTGTFNGANAQAVPLVTDGTYYYSPVQRNFAGQFLEDVTDLNTSVYPLSAWANGVLQAGAGTNYTLMGPGLAIPGYSYEGLYVKWTAEPTGPITMLAQFFFRVRLESDEQDVEEFLQQLWTVGGTSSKNGSGYLKLMSSRVPTT